MAKPKNWVELRHAALRRTQLSRKAMGEWYNESRGKMQEIPFPYRMGGYKRRKLMSAA